MGEGHATLSDGFTSAQHRTPKTPLTASSHRADDDNFVDPGATICPPLHVSSAHTSTKSK